MTATQVTATQAQQLNKPVLKIGSQGAAVKEMQSLLNQLLFRPGVEGDPLPVDGIYGADTEFAVKRTQTLYFMAADGIVGQQTWQLLFSQANTTLPTLDFGSKGELVRKVQGRLARNRYDVGVIDGEYGARTKNAVRKFQLDMGLTTDGIISKKTWKALSTRLMSL
jgi:peptidoglycan hydrolase-like protein with peptidoglycan-binding domain